ncbi:MAG: hypothetical protein EBR82_13040 [Caulobacteraceae bacterium]|nr:hypothetical protein [Caulobacteraceae bacterium]
MSAQVTQEDKDTLKVNIEVDCPCEVGICDHSMEEVSKALQQAYTRGVRDGATGAMENVREYLKKEYPGEYAKVEAAANESKRKLN